MNLAKMLNQIIPRLVENKVSLDFFQIKINPKGIKNYLIFLDTVIRNIVNYPNKHVSLATYHRLMFSVDKLDRIM